MNTDSDTPTDEHHRDRSGDAPGELGFSGCLEELDQIVRGLETDSVDVDELSETVARAADLVEWCRTRLGDTRTRLEEVLPRLELADAPEPEPDASDR